MRILRWRRKITRARATVGEIGRTSAVGPPQLIARSSSSHFARSLTLFAARFGICEVETLLKTVRLNPAELSPQFLIAKADRLKLRFESSRH